jgi:hypothetical protein
MPSTKTTIGRTIAAYAPSVEVARRIDAQDSSLAVQAAVYRAETKLAELRGLYESECSRIRTAMLAEVAAIEIAEGE